MIQIIKKAAAVLSLLFLLVSVPAAAAETYTEGDFYYQLEEEAIQITGYFGSEEEVTIPAVIAGYPVSIIATGAFSENNTVRRLNLPDTIMEIEQDAIGQGITVNYNTNIETSKEETAREEQISESESDQVKEDSVQTESSRDSVIAEAEVSLISESTQEMIGMATGIQKNILTVDESNHLILKNENGDIQMIDDANEYSLHTAEDGTASIISQGGEEVSVDEEGNIITENKSIAKIREDGTIQKENQETAEQKDTEKEAAGNTAMPWIVIIIAVILVLIGTTVLEGRREGTD